MKPFENPNTESEQESGLESQFESEKNRLDQNVERLGHNIEEAQEIPEDAGEEVDEERSRIYDFVSNHTELYPIAIAAFAEGSKAIGGKTDIVEILMALGLGVGMSLVITRAQEKAKARNLKWDERKIFKS